MLKEHSSFIKQAIAFFDILLLGFAFFCAFTLVSSFSNIKQITDYWLMFVGFLGFYLYFAWTRSLFSILQFNWRVNLFNRIMAIFISAGILGASILYVLPEAYDSRRLYITFVFFSLFFILCEKLLLSRFFISIRRKGKNITPIMLFGKGREASQIKKEIEMNPEWGLRISKTLDLSLSPKRFENILRAHHVEEIFFCIPRSASKNGFSVDPYLQVCEEMGRSARVFLNIYGATRFARWEYQQFLNRSTLISHTVELDPDQILFKRIFDISGSLVGLALLAVIYPFLAILIKLTSPGPVFFKQLRVGKNGKKFLIYKFRSMTADAEHRKKDLETKNELNGAVFKIKNDPRVTTIGKFMRKTSLDEIPQFLNVLRGEMSLVGTRPPTPDEVSKYQKWHHRRISIKPGITGLWQVSGRNKITDFDEIVKLDLRYIDRWSIWQDLIIIFKTVFVVFRDEAY